MTANSSAEFRDDEDPMRGPGRACDTWVSIGQFRGFHHQRAFLSDRTRAFEAIKPLSNRRVVVEADFRLGSGFVAALAKAGPVRSSQWRAIPSDQKGKLTKT